MTLSPPEPRTPAREVGEAPGLTAKRTGRGAARNGAKAHGPHNGPQLSPARTSELIRQALEDDKAEDIVTIDIAGKSSVADVIMIASGRSQRHVGALADHLAQKLKEAGASVLSVEGLPHCDWVLVDAGDVIIHLFRPEVRNFYNIERIWTPIAPVRAAS